MFTQQDGKLGYQLASLAISDFAPLIMYFAIRSSVASDTEAVASDTEALALAWFIPVVWTLGSSLWQRRLDVFGLFGVVAYGIALAISIFFGAGALPLKLHRALVTGVVGLVCLISFAVGKPIFVLFTRRSVKNTAHATQIEVALADPLVVRRISNLTLAIVLSTSAFLVATTVIHVAALVGIVLGVLLFFWVKSNR